MAQRPTEAIGPQVALARTRRGWTQQELADHLQATDTTTTLNRAAVAKIESGVRGVSIDEALLIAATLNVPPVMLLLPVGTDHRVRLAGHDVSTLDALGWFLGRHGVGWLLGQPVLLGGDGLAGEDEILGERGWIEGYEPVRLYEDARQARGAALYAHDLLLARREQDDDAGAEDALEHLRDSLRWLGDSLRSLQASRLRVPPVDPRFLEVMERLGLDTSGLRPWVADDGEG